MVKRAFSTGHFRFRSQFSSIFTRNMESTLLLQHIAEHITLTADEQAYFVSPAAYRKIKKRQFLTQEGDITKGRSLSRKGSSKLFG